jgi:hypothetical protein
MKISPLPHSSQVALLYKSIKLSNLIKYNSNTANNLTIDCPCTSSSCSYQTIVLTPSTYKIELWGSQGGTATYSASPGNGSYVSGTFIAIQDTTLYAFIGNTNGYNGGGSGGSGPNSGANGGGATDIRLGGTGFDNRIMVAGGGGGGGAHSNGGALYVRDALKGTVGGNGDEDGGFCDNTFYGKPGKKGTQTSGGSGGSNGVTSYSSYTDSTYYPSAGGGGGGGYYGGGGGGSGATQGGSNRDGNIGNTGSVGNGGSGASAAYSSSITAGYSSASAGGGGGSSFIDSSRVSKIQLLNGNTSFANVVGEMQIGNQRNGAIRIAQLDNSVIKSAYACTCNYYPIFAMQNLIKIAIILAILQ